MIVDLGEGISGVQGLGFRKIGVGLCSNFAKCEVPTSSKNKPQVVATGRMGGRLREELGNVSPFQSLGVGGVGAPCIKSPEVVKCDVSFRLSLWSWEWSREWRELMVVRPLSELGSWGVRGGSYVEVPTCKVSKHFRVGARS
jgi:hypothetical protein